MPVQVAQQQENLQTMDKLDVGIDTGSPSNKVAWSTGRNVRFTPGYVSKILGKTNLSSLLVASLPVRAIFTFMDTNGVMRNIACTDSKIYASDCNYTATADITDISPLGWVPTGDANDLWEFTIVAGLPILTNGKDGIWKWPDPTSTLIPLLNFPICKNIGCCMHRLIGSYAFQDPAGSTGNKTWMPDRILWSEMGNPENVVIDTSRKAGQFDLVNYHDGEDTQHNILCQIVDGSKVYFFTERNVWATDFSQSSKQFVIIDPDFQLLSRRSAVLDKGTVYAIDKRDLYRFTASKGALYPGGKEPIAKTMKKLFFASLNTAALHTAFAFPMITTNEIWFCVSTGSNILPDTAYIYNWELGNWTICDCDFLCHGRQYPQSFVTWQNNSLATITWQNNTPATVKWLINYYNSIAKDVCGDSVSHINLMDSGYNAINTSLQATAINGVIESGDMNFSRANEFIMGFLYPDILAQTLTNSLMIQIGARESLSQAIQWGPAVSFRIGIDFYADMRNYISQGAFIRLRFYTNVASSPWSLGSYEFAYSRGRQIR